MSYEPTIWVNGQEPALNADNLNKLERAVESASTPAWADITGKPATFAPTIGKTATTAMAGNTVIPEQATWANLGGKPAVVAAGADAAAARTAIGAGTSSLVIGTTASTAKAGNYTPAWGDITGKPATFAPVIGTTATTAKAGDYVSDWSDITGKPSTFAPIIGATATTAAAGNHNHAVTADAASGLVAAATIQALAVALSTRIKALEDAAQTP